MSANLELCLRTAFTVQPLCNSHPLNGTKVAIYGDGSYKGVRYIVKLSFEESEVAIIRRWLWLTGNNSGQPSENVSGICGQ